MINEKNVKLYCSEDASNIENYDLAIADQIRTWDCHHRLEIQPDGTEVSCDELMSRGMYYHRPSSELIFLTKSEHTILHMKGNTPPNKGVPMSDDQKTKLSKSLKNYFSNEDNRRKHSEAHKGKKHSEETKRKMSEAHKEYWEKKRMTKD